MLKRNTDSEEFTELSPVSPA